MAVDIKVREVDIYLITPICIYDYKSFEAGLTNKGWCRANSVQFDLYSLDAIYESSASLLGMTKNDVACNFPHGDCFVLPDIEDGATLVSSFRHFFSGKEGKLTLSSKKYKDESNPVWADELEMGKVFRLHISPDKSLGLFLGVIRRPQFKEIPNKKQKRPVLPISIDTIENTVYLLQKSDEQAPSIFIDGSNIMGCDTFMDIVSMLALSDLAEGVAGFMVPNRIITASYLQILMPEIAGDEKAEFNKEVDNRILHIGQNKGSAFDLVESDAYRTHHLFENIRVSASPEGFCGGFLVDETKRNATFIAKSSTTFLKSYIPVFLETIILDYMSLRMVEAKKIDNLTEQTNLFRKLNMSATMPVSRYAHLQQLKQLLLPIFFIPEKINTVATYLADLQKKEEQMNMERINKLLGFMSIGGVCFAVFRIIGVKDLFGGNFSASLWIKCFVTVCIALFAIISIWIVIKITPLLFKRKR